MKILWTNWQLSTKMPGATNPRRNPWFFAICLSAILIAVVVLFYAFYAAIEPDWPRQFGTVHLKNRSFPGARGRGSRPMSRIVPTPDLIFDPVLVYASFLGGASYQQYDEPAGQAANVIFADASGNLYVGGTTNSPAFPVTSGVVESKNAGGYALGFLCKLSPSGQSLTFSTYIDGISSVQAMAVDTVGNIYVAGPAGPPTPVCLRYRSLLDPRRSRPQRKA